MALPAIKPIADCRPDLDIVDGLAKAMKRAYEKDGVFPDQSAISRGTMEITRDPHRVARELNGRYLVDVTDKDGKSFAAGKQVSGFAQLRDDGTTMSGNWIYCGGYTEEGDLRRAPRYDRCAEWHWTLSKVVVGLADEPAHSLQPRLGRSQRRALQPARMGHPLECREKNLGRRCA